VVLKDVGNPMWHLNFWEHDAQPNDDVNSLKVTSVVRVDYNSLDG
jgi:hypothetical protein